MSDQPIIVARQLAASLDGMSRRLDTVKEDSEKRDQALTEYGQQNRRILRRHRLVIWAGIVLFLIDIGLTVRVSVVASDADRAAASAHSAAVKAQRAADTANQTRQAARVSCRNVNAVRAENVTLWDYLIAASNPGPSASSAQKAADQGKLAALKTKVAKTYAPQDCARLYGPGG